MSTIDAKALLETLERINWSHGRGDIRQISQVTVNLVDGTTTGYAHRQFQYGGDRRKFTILANGKVRFLQHNRKIARHAS